MAICSSTFSFCAAITMTVFLAQYAHRRKLEFLSFIVICTALSCLSSAVSIICFSHTRFASYTDSFLFSSKIESFGWGYYAVVSVFASNAIASVVVGYSSHIIKRERREAEDTIRCNSRSEEYSRHLKKYGLQEIWNMCFFYTTFSFQYVWRWSWACIRSILSEQLVWIC